MWEAGAHSTCIVLYVVSFVSCSSPSCSYGSALKETIYSILMRWFRERGNRFTGVDGQQCVIRLRKVALVSGLLMILLKLLCSRFSSVFKSRTHYRLLIWSLSITELHIWFNFSLVIQSLLSGDAFAPFSVLLGLMCIGWLVMESVVFCMIVGWALVLWSFIILQWLLGC